MKGSKGRSWPIPDAGSFKSLFYKLSEVLASETKHDINYERKPGEVTPDGRDGAVHALRFLKVWFDLPRTVLFSAVYYLDQFLARLKVQDKYLSCLTVSCFNVAAEKHGYKLDASQLVMLSQSRCTVKDMQRMSTIITQKLNLGNSNNDHTVLDLLNMYFEIIKCFASHHKTLWDTLLAKQEQLYTRLEYLIADSSCAFYKTSMLALAFIHCEMETFLAKTIAPSLSSRTTELMLIFMIELQRRYEGDASEYTSCFDTVSNIMEKYESNVKVKHGQKLSWRFSTNLSMSRLSQNFYSVLDTVNEE